MKFFGFKTRNPYGRDATISLPEKKSQAAWTIPT
jgi:hypothetical protein